MTSSARYQFLDGLSALSDATEEPTVKAPNSMGAFIRRGLTVAAYNLLETFIADRWAELAAFMNGGNTQFLDLPERLQRRAIKQTIVVAQNELRRANMSISDLRSYARNLGNSLSAVSTDLRISPLTWKWEGSNMSADEFASSLRFIHVPQPFETVRELSGRLGFTVTAPDGTPIDLKDDLHRFAQERHMSAHVASHPVTSLWLRTVPDRVMRFGATFDILASTAAAKIRSGDTEFLTNDKWLVSDRIPIRFVQQRKADFAVLKEKAPRAIRVGPDGDQLFRDACSAFAHETIVRRNLARSVVDWSIPAVG